MVLLHDTDLDALAAGEIVLRDEVLGEPTARRMLDEARGLAGAAAPAGIGRDRVRDGRVRGDAIVWVDPPALAPLHAAFEDLRATLNRAYLGLTTFDVQLARYPGDGAAYIRHRDAFHGGTSRVVTAIYYLNPDWGSGDGGALRVHLRGGARDIEPRLDRMVAFLSDAVEHEVLPTARERLAVTAWYRR
jgi:SM-20-related protein